MRASRRAARSGPRSLAAPATPMPASGRAHGADAFAMDLALMSSTLPRLVEWSGSAAAEPAGLLLHERRPALLGGLAGRRGPPGVGHQRLLGRIGRLARQLRGALGLDHAGLERLGI